MATKRPASPTHVEYLFILSWTPFFEKGLPKITKGGPFDPHWPISRINSAKGAFLWDDLGQDQWSEITWVTSHQMSWWIHSGQGSVDSLFWYNMIQVILEHWSWSWSSQRNAPRYLGTWKRLDVELQVVIKKSKTGEIYQFENRKSTFGSKVSRQRQHYIKEVLEFSVFNVILQHWQKPAPGEVTRSTSANKQQHFVTNNVNWIPINTDTEKAIGGVRINVVLALRGLNWEKR